MTPEGLSRLRFPVESSLGRRYPELPHPYRNSFQRDRDRIIHARSFRRLEDKTQVFAPALSDHFRNRLTHTIEVTQIARTAAAVLQLEQDLVEPLALAHDIGHPPFGHAGEEELNRQMALFGDRFDHNLHALRIVDSFEQRYALFPGLNLTFEVREGIVKHSRDLDPGCDPELREFLPGLRPPLEAQIIDLADEIAYDTADLDDGHSAGLIDPDALAASVPAFGEIREKVEQHYPGAAPRIQFLECVRSLVDLLVSSLIEGTTTAGQGIETIDGVRRNPARLARFSSEGQQTATTLKAFLHHHVYASQTLVKERQRSTEAISELFQLFQNHPGRMPPGYQERTKHEPAHRVVCDYIAGMTDGYFRRVWSQELGQR